MKGSLKQWNFQLKRKISENAFKIRFQMALFTYQN